MRRRCQGPLPPAPSFLMYVSAVTPWAPLASCARQYPPPPPDAHRSRGRGHVGANGKGPGNGRGGEEPGEGRSIEVEGRGGRAGGRAVQEHIKTSKAYDLRMQVRDEGEGGGPTVFCMGPHGRQRLGLGGRTGRPTVGCRGWPPPRRGQPPRPTGRREWRGEGRGGIHGTAAAGKVKPTKRTKQTVQTTQKPPAGPG